ncbi:DUF6283 family protein [Nocardia sp. CWNU-33]|uniref:DUF6283 family protein n=1 Tax=Nocardia sp. CWNU-33 TaxID=3392117 RepID=UPI00398EDB29
MFPCHQTDAENDRRRLCSGWVGCHGSDLLGLSMALLRGRIGAGTFQAAVDYRSPVPLFASGSEAADHGQAEINCPGTDADPSGRWIWKPIGGTRALVLHPPLSQFAWPRAQLRTHDNDPHPRPRPRP